MRTLGIDDVLGPHGLLGRGMPGYEHRSSQLAMGRAVLSALERDELLLVEAGTGTGKTLAYLVPAVLSGKKVVISTGTKTLQDQILEHDLPLLERHLGVAINAAVMKGLNNYLCLRRFDEYVHGAQSLLGRNSRSLPQLIEWAGGTHAGDRAELSLPDDDMLWGEVQSGADTRIGPKCRFYDDCFVTQMRARAQAARIVIVNHHLYFADLALRGDHPGGVIPEHDAVIFDEAHLIEDVATEFFGASVSSRKLAVLLRDASRTLTAHGLSSQGERLLAQLAVCADEMVAAVPRAAEGGRVLLAPEVIAARLREPWLVLDTALEALWAFCQRNVAEGEPLAQLARRAEQVRTDLATICDGGGRDRVNYAHGRGKGVTLSSSPVEIAPVLRDRLFQRGLSVVLTSATLAIDGSFAFVRERLGIDQTCEEHVLASPFDFAAQAALYIPELPDPRASEYFDDALKETLALIELTGGGAFVLCTSHRMVQRFDGPLRAALGARLLVQGEAPNAVLLARFREHGDAVLLATASFWQGVDVPGRALRLVIMDKLPFDVPSDPLVAARCERLEQRGEQPFMRYLVPSAALTLKQGFGRLIRTRADHGIVAILDSRLSRKGYGKALLRSLPPAKRCRSMAEVDEAFRLARAEHGDA